MNNTKPTISSTQDSFLKQKQTLSETVKIHLELIKKHENLNAFLEVFDISEDVKHAEELKQYRQDLIYPTSPILNLKS